MFCLLMFLKAVNENVFFCELPNYLSNSSLENINNEMTGESWMNSGLLFIHDVHLSINIEVNMIQLLILSAMFALSGRFAR